MVDAIVNRILFNFSFVIEVPPFFSAYVVTFGKYEAVLIVQSAASGMSK